jgi:hypothetical protein
MAILLFCTSYITEESFNRYYSWLDFYSDKFYGQVDYLIINDGPIDLELKEKLYDLAFKKNIKLYIKSFNDKRGQNSHRHWGWWRSFLTALDFGKNNYEQLIHIESDAVVLSERLKNYLLKKEPGWFCLHTEIYGFKESAIQKIDENVFHVFDSLDHNYNFEKIIELYLPMRRNINFIGDRYGESGKLPNHKIDYVCQWNWNWIIEDDWIIK